MHEFISVQDHKQFIHSTYGFPRDHIGLFWSDLSNHIARIIVKAHGLTHLLERTVVGLLHLASRLLGRHSSAIQVLIQCIRLSLEYIMHE